jgi:hypothetical protein
MHRFYKNNNLNGRVTATGPQGESLSELSLFSLGPRGANVSAGRRWADGAYRDRSRLFVDLG